MSQQFKFTAYDTPLTIQQEAKCTEIVEQNFKLPKLVTQVAFFLQPICWKNCHCVLSSKVVCKMKVNIIKLGVLFPGGSGSEYESETDDEGTNEDGSPKRRRKKKVGKGGVSKEKMIEIEAQIEADRKKLESQKDLAEEEKRRVQDDLEKKEEELKNAK